MTDIDSSVLAGADVQDDDAATATRADGSRQVRERPTTAGDLPRRERSDLDSTPVEPVAAKLPRRSSPAGSPPLPVRVQRSASSIRLVEQVRATVARHQSESHKAPASADDGPVLRVRRRDHRNLGPDPMPDAVRKSLSARIRRSASSDAEPRDLADQPAAAGEVVDRTVCTATLRASARPQRVVINRAPEPSEVQLRLERERKQLTVGIVDPAEFAIELAAEFDRRSRGGRNCMIGTISIFEIPGLRYRYGSQYVFDRVSEVTAILHEFLTPMDIVTVAEDGEIIIMARESRLNAAINRVEKVCKAIASRRFDVDGEGVLLTPSGGVATLDDGTDPADVVRRAVDAREVAAGHLDLSVHRWEPAMSADTAPAEKQPFNRFNWQNIKERLRAPVQILATYVVGLFIPFCFYWTMANVVGFDITYFVYLTVVVVLVLTGMMILVEANQAVKQKEPPEVDEYPLATAIICAYLPNEAATIMGTLDAFLNQGYPGGLQIIVAYNTPSSMPIERELAQLALDHPDLDIVRVEGSTSKAQNVNAVLAMARGEFIGMFDADHEPRPGSFERSWRWLANGYDVVQGHCLTRNAEETKLARMVAVEFESIYAVAHPGRAKLHRFGVFGGSNGYWKTDLLHETRMRGSMLTEDIDSSMRTVERGLKIRSDRDVVSRELGTTTFEQVWNQRLRWAQGWFQVTMMHTMRVWRSPGLTFRQKFGASYLLGYRELYPWLSLQIFPLVAFWLTQGDSLGLGFPLFFCTTLFVLHIGPVQTWYAYRLADWEIKQHKSWFFAYLIFSTLFYTEYKNTIARVAHIKEFVGERAWKVTPRGDDRIEFEDDEDLEDLEDLAVVGADAVDVVTVGEVSIDESDVLVRDAAPSLTAGGLPKRARPPADASSVTDAPIPLRSEDADVAGDTTADERVERLATPDDRSVRPIGSPLERIAASRLGTEELRLCGGTSRSGGDLPGRRRSSEPGSVDEPVRPVESDVPAAGTGELPRRVRRGDAATHDPARLAPQTDVPVPTVVSRPESSGSAAPASLPGDLPVRTRRLDSSGSAAPAALPGDLPVRTQRLDSSGSAAPAAAPGDLPVRTRRLDSSGSAAPAAAPADVPAPIASRSPSVRSAAPAALPKRGDATGMESGRLARRAAGLVPTAGLAGEAVLPPCGRGVGALPAARFDEAMISARVRQLANRPTAKRSSEEASDRAADEPADAVSVCS